MTQRLITPRLAWLSCLALALQIAGGYACAQEANIRKNLAEKMPRLPKIDEVSKTPMNGLYEVRVNSSDIFYTDADGNFLIEGSLIDVRSKRNLTQERVDKLTAIAFDTLPLKDTFSLVRGNGKRKLAVFSDPNCGYCKKLEQDLQKVSDVTVYVFLLPVLGADSVQKSKHIWCAKDKGKVWLDWMLRNQAVPSASCDTSVLERNLEFAKKQKINGTPALIFTNGTRIPGAMKAADIEKILDSSNTP